MNFVENIKNNINIKESLIGLKAQLRDHYFEDEDHDLKQKLLLLLQDEDPKIRKNSAAILGYYPDTIDVLLKAYVNEDKEYVKDAYLKGISMQDYEPYIQELKTIQEQLLKSQDVNLKHIQAQLKILNPMILQKQSHCKKVVKLQHDPVDVVLTSLPYYQFVLLDDVLHLKYKPVSQGVLVRTTSLYELLSIRTYKDMLITIQGGSGLEMSLNAIVDGLKRSNIMDVLGRLYDSQSLFYYRVVDGLRHKDPQLIKKVSEKLFELYPEKLLNTSENYDIEILLKEVKRDKVNIYLKLSHLKNPRFQYRKEVIATSMQPYVAATLIKLATPYLLERARVLDPFVGAGTLLIERSLAKQTHFAMGIDVYGAAVEVARRNTSHAELNIHYVHKDALRFVNNEMFDEIITDMPTFAQMKDQEQLQNLYDRFFDRIRRLVRPEGYVFLYTSEISLVRKNLRLQKGYLMLEEHYEIPRGKNMFYFFIIKVK